MKNKISKQKRNLINELSFWVLPEIERLVNSHNMHNNTTQIHSLINVVKASKHYTNKQIKTLINDLKYQLPF